jgi:hypothetical protein
MYSKYSCMTPPEEGIKEAESYVGVFRTFLENLL